MTTPIWLTGFEYGVMTANGTGLVNSISGGAGVTVQSTIKNTGTYAIRFNTSASASYITKTIPSGGGAVIVGRAYFYFTTRPNANCIMFRLSGATADLGFRFNSANNTIFPRLNGVDNTANASPTLNTGQWYRLDWRIDVSGSTATLDWKIDGTDQTQETETNTSDTLTSMIIGVNFNVATADWYCDDVVLSATTGDYPIGAGGTVAISPSADGTHNAGTNIMEDNAGTDIGTTTAFDKLNSIPPSSTTYVRQAAVGTGNYAEVSFADFSVADSTAIGALAVLAYTSETTTGNNGGCIVSVNGFSSSTTLWGAPGALSDYSDGSTANLFYKTVMVGGAVSNSTVDAIQARVGYSGDATPDPYWIDLIVEVGYVPAAPKGIVFDNRARMKGLMVR